MISGRGLGITGGTLDKLDAIPGFQTVLPLDRVQDLVQRVGCVICGQTERMVPADRKLYALRDATGTVPSIPLIVASILSKKQAAEDLAQAMATLGNQCGARTRAVLTNMDIPLGRAAGNWLEVRESVACLEGRGPADLNDLVLAFAAHLLVMTGKSGSYDEARARAHDCLASGQPAAKWREMLAAQGADLEAYDRKLKRESNAASVATLAADRGGFVTHCDARILGEVVRDLGAGRLTRESAIDYDVGVDGLAKPGEQVAPGQVLARIHAQTMAAAEIAREKLSHAICIGDTPPDPRPLILKQIGT
jgi:thymidine phosphorylase